MKKHPISVLATSTVLLLGMSFAVHAAPGEEPEPVMVDIVGGTYTMGAPDQAGSSERKDEQPAHQVNVKPFRLGKFEVTFAQYDAYTDAVGKPRVIPPKELDAGRGPLPVIRVSWQEAVDYAQWLSAKTGKKYRLPSEAEWQYAARAGTTTDYYWGKAPATDHANSGLTWGKPSASGNDKWINFAPVGQFPANPFGLHDMHGNAWEWMQDCYNDNYIGAPTDGSAWLMGDCSRRVQVGNSFHNGPTPVTTRGGGAKANPTVGFRLAQDY